MTKVYRILLSGMGDIEEKLVDEEAWNWICSDDTGRRDNPDNQDTYWKDETVPQIVKDNWEEHFGDKYPEEGIWLTSGSWENDRALSCPHDSRFTVGETSFEDTWEGYIY